jgi:hypothetical protein
MSSRIAYPLVRELAADNIPVGATCRALGLAKQGRPSTSGAKQPMSQHERDDAHLIRAA